MEFVIDFLFVGNGNAIFVWGRIPNKMDYVILIDAGDQQNSARVIYHFNHYIKPFLLDNHSIGFVLTNWKPDHVGGILEVITHLHDKFEFGVCLNPMEFLQKEMVQNVNLNLDQQALNINNNPHLDFNSFYELNKRCQQYNIKQLNPLKDDLNLMNNAFKIISPSFSKYQQWLQQFDNQEIQLSNTASQLFEDDLSLIVQLTDVNNHKYLLTSKATVDSFDDLLINGFNPKGFKLVQLPNKGTKDSINDKWISLLSPKCFVANAGVNPPDSSIVQLIKQLLPNTELFANNIDKTTLSHVTNQDIFPNRNWVKADLL